ncbi:MAG: hypothetical protein FVQ82_10665 [Planctomycetes bacterium]|nr:hypothetical protein [Planctomycetota bacterium]
MDKNEMEIFYGKFAKFVVILVTVIGFGFGGWAGVMYAESTGRGMTAILGAVLGGASGFVLSKLYLKYLVRIIASELNAFVRWLLPTLAAVVCGLVCTTIIHAILSGILVMTSEKPLTEHWDGLWSAIVVGCEVTGAIVGFAAGALCTSLYMWKVIDKNETAEETKIDETNELS